MKKLFAGMLLLASALAVAQTNGLVYGIALYGPTANQLRFIATGTNISVYNDIFDAVSPDWNATVGQPGYIMNKPTVGGAQIPSDWAQTNSGAVDFIKNKPTTLAGYGITDAVTTSALANYVSNSFLANTLTNYATTASVTTGLATKFNTPTGTTSQYLRGDGSLAVFPSFGTGTVTSITAGTGLSGGTITTSGTISMPSVGTAGTYSGVTTGAQGRVTAGTTRSFNYTTRALNTCYQVSATRDAFVSYSVDIATSLSLTAGQQGTVYLRTYTNSTCTTGAQELMRFVNGQTGTLTIGLALTQNVTGTLSGIVPAGAWVQQVSENNTGTPTFTARPGQEVLM